MLDKFSIPSPEVFNHHPGTLFARWRGTLAFLTGADNSPYHDALIGPVMQSLENVVALHVATQFTVGFDNAAQQEREIGLERRPTHKAKGGCGVLLRRHLSRPISGEEALVRSFRWYGQLAYAKGIDCSPSHDRATAKLLRQHPNDLVVTLIRAWEGGWDDALQLAQELCLDRQSIIERPAVISARLVRRPTRKTEK